MTGPAEPESCVVCGVPIRPDSAGVYRDAEGCAQCDLQTPHRPASEDDEAAPVVDVAPGPHEVAVVFLPPGVGLTRHGKPFLRSDDFFGYATVPGADMKWGAAVCWYGGLAGIRNGHRKTDRDVWHHAGRLLIRASVRRTRPAVVYVVHEPRDYFGREELQAVTVRQELDEAAVAHAAMHAAGFPVVPPGQIAAEVAADVTRLTGEG